MLNFPEAKWLIGLTIVSGVVSWIGWVCLRVSWYRRRYDHLSSQYAKLLREHHEPMLERVKAGPSEPQILAGVIKQRDLLIGKLRNRIDSLEQSLGSRYSAGDKSTIAENSKLRVEIEDLRELIDLWEPDHTEDMPSDQEVLLAKLRKNVEREHDVDCIFGSSDKPEDQDTDTKDDPYGPASKLLRAGYERERNLRQLGFRPHITPQTNPELFNISHGGGYFWKHDGALYVGSKEDREYRHYMGPDVGRADEENDDELDPHSHEAAVKAEGDTPEPKPRIHVLKVMPDHWESLCDGIKPFEIRLDDRGFRVGDWLRLEERSWRGHLTGEFEIRLITCMVGYRQETGYRVLGLSNPDEKPVHFSVVHPHA